jgi:hypothetical protein
MKLLKGLTSSSNLLWTEEYQFGFSINSNLVLLIWSPNHVWISERCAAWFWLMMILLWIQDVINQCSTIQFMIWTMDLKLICISNSCELNLGEFHLSKMNYIKSNSANIHQHKKVALHLHCSKNLLYHHDTKSVTFAVMGNNPAILLLNVLIRDMNTRRKLYSQQSMLYLEGWWLIIVSVIITTMICFLQLDRLTSQTCQLNRLAGRIQCIRVINLTKLLHKEGWTCSSMTMITWFMMTHKLFLLAKRRFRLMSPNGKGIGQCFPKMENVLTHIFFSPKFFSKTI